MLLFILDDPLFLNHYDPVGVREVEHKVFYFLKLRILKIDPFFHADEILPSRFLGGKGQSKINSRLTHPDIGQGLQVDDIMFYPDKFGHNNSFVIHQFEQTVKVMA